MLTAGVRRSLSTLWLWPLGLLASFVSGSGPLTNITLQNTAPQLQFLPSLCDNGVLQANIPPNCIGTWTNMELDGSSNGSVASTIGPSPQFGNLTPQVFLIFRAQAVYIKSSNNSTALANLTISSTPSGEVVTRVFQPGSTFFFYVGLDETQVNTLSVTWLAMSMPSRLDVDFVKLSVSNASATDTIFPSQPPLPTQPMTTSVSTSTSSPTISVSPSLSTTSKTPEGTIIAVSIFGGLALLAIIAALLFFWRRRSRRRQEDRMFTETGKVQAATQVLSLTPSIAQDAPQMAATYGAPGTFGSRMVAEPTGQTTPRLPPIPLTPQSLTPSIYRIHPGPGRGGEG